MLFETFYGLDKLRVMQGFEGENEKYYEAALLLGANSIGEDLKNIPVHFIVQDLKENADKKLSLFCLDPNDNVVGVFFINTRSIFDEFEKAHQHHVTVEQLTDLEEYKNMKGLHGMLFAVKRDDRKSYIAWLLMSEVIRLYKSQYDYIFGIQSDVFKNNVKYGKRAHAVAKQLPIGGYDGCTYYLRKFNDLNDLKTI